MAEKKEFSWEELAVIKTVLMEKLEAENFPVNRPEIRGISLAQLWNKADSFQYEIEQSIERELTQ